MIHKYIKTSLFTAAIFITTLFYSCIDEYNHPGIDQVRDIIVVEGKISSDSSVFRLSKSVGINEDTKDVEWLENAIVRVEREDGQLFEATTYRGEGYYFIPTEKLQKEKMYRLYFKYNNKEYVSEYLAPFITPEVEEINWDKKGKDISFYVSTRDPENKSKYYQWSYNETWEFHTEYYATFGFLYATHGPIVEFNLYNSDNRYYCWGHSKSNKFILGSTEKLTGNVISNQKLATFDSSHEKFSIMYYIRVSQNQIRKEAFDYYSNLQKNIEQTGSIFTPIPAELHGNITSLSNPKEVVIGYIEVSTTTFLDKYVSCIEEDIYDPPMSTCFSTNVHIDGYGIYEITDKIDYAPLRCVDCRLRGTKEKPENWPTFHL